MLAIGKVAKCKKGLTGLVLRVSKVKSITMYYGICIDPGRVGRSWQSALPEWIGTLNDWVRIRYAELMELDRAANVAFVKQVLSDTPSKRNLST